MRPTLLLAVFTLLTTGIVPAAYAQTPAVEICDNQIDDDNDGYVDCYDSDCQCFSGEDCSVPDLKTDFRARLAWQSGQNGPSITAIPVVANMNPQQDSMPEIIVAAAAPAGNATPNKILFFRGDGSNLNGPMTLTVPGGFDGYPVPGPTIGDINGDGRPELIMSCDDRRIRVFRNYTENPTNPMTLWITSSGQLDYEDQKPYLADFNGDGIPEIYAGSDIFKFDFSNPTAPALNKVINGLPNIGRALYNLYQEGSCSPTAVDLLSVADCNGDPDCAGLELAAGPVIYSIDVDPNDGDGYQIKIKRDLNQISPGNNYGDGYTAVADINLDGVLDVVVSGRRNNSQTGVYAWDKNKFLGFFPYPNGNNRSGSLACIANLFDDRTRGFAKDYPEIVVCNAYNLNCFNLQAATISPAAPYWWSLVTKDYSGFTGSSVYDFNGDGIFELVYRDEDNFRILYGGAAPFPPGVDAERNWFKIPCGSLTSDEYPVVADVDNDGETEVAVTGYTFSGYNTPSTDYRGRLRVFESDAEPWVPCRNVWNQFNYFVVNVNDDLSIPKQQQLHHLELPAAGSGNRPLNRYLSQRQLLDENFQPFLPVPDALAEVQQVVCKQDTLRVDLNVCNNGSHRLPAGTPVTFYQGDPTTSNASVLGTVQTIGSDVAEDSCRSFSFKVPYVAGDLYGVINDDGSHSRPFSLGTDFPVTDLIECNWVNNIFSFHFTPPVAPFELGPDIAACTDTIVLLSAGTDHQGYRWQDGSTDSIFLAAAPGLYWVEVSDYCIASRTDTLRVEVFGNPVIQLDTINGDCAGKPASATVSGLSQFLPLDVLWSSGHKSMFVDSLEDGWYEVTVTDAMGCSSSASTWVEAGGWLKTSSVTGAILCYGQTAEISVSIEAGQQPFLYQWSNTVSQDSIQHVQAGEYEVTVTDADGCTQVADFKVVQPGALLSNGISATGTCPDVFNGTAQFNGALDGTPPYTLLWSTGSTAGLLNDLPAGTVDLTVTDANGCSVVEHAAVPLFTLPELNADIAPVSCFGQNDGRIAVTVLGGSPDFGFQWSGGQTTPTIEHLGPGDYSLTFTYAGNKCVHLYDYPVTEPPVLEMNASYQNPLCAGGYDGAIAVLAEGGTAPYQYVWSTGQQTTAIQMLPAGVYTATVIDSHGCTAIQPVELTTPLPLLSAGVVAEPACPGLSTGAVHFAGALQGTPPYQINWFNGSNVADIANLPAGVYPLTITDAHGCTVTDSGTVPAYLEPALEALVTPVSCFGELDGAISVDVSGGSPGYAFSWSTTANTPVIEHLGPGGYTLTLYYADEKCSRQYDFTIHEPEELLASATQQDPLCAGSSDGVIEVNVGGGTAPYSFLWSSGSGSASVKNLVAGQYTVTVSDAHACSRTLEVVLSEPSPLLLTDSALSVVQCFGDSTGSIHLELAGGVSPYQYTWSTGQLTRDISSLPAGMYVVSVTDAQDCPLTLDFQITQPEKIDISAAIIPDTCHRTTGSAAITATGGVLPYQFQWSNGALDAQLSALASGTYSLTLTDANHCPAVLQVEVPGLGEAPIAELSMDTITCYKPFSNIKLLINQIEVQVSWTGPTGPMLVPPGPSVAAPGQYTVLVSNIYGCTAIASAVAVENRTLPLADAGAELVKAGCDETAVLLDASASSTGPNYLNLWRETLYGSVVFDTVAVYLSVHDPGVYVHIVKDLRNGCTASDTVQVQWAEPVVAALLVDSISCFGANDGVIQFTNISGGTPPLYYSIDNQHFQSSSVFYNLPPGAYPVSVRDDQGCIWNAEVLMLEPDSLAVDLMASDSVIELGQPLRLEARPSPANVNLQAILWNPKSAFDFTPMALRQTVWPKESSEFEVMLVDIYGCVATDRVAIRVDNNQIYVPNAIYPGSDENGFFTIFSGDGVREIQLLRIFDRWGNQVFENRHFPTNALRYGWDGDFRQEPVNPGVFTWYAQLELRNGRILLLKGDVTVVR